MNWRFISRIIALIVLATTPCLAGNKNNQDTVPLDKIKARVEKAQSKSSRVTIKLTNGESIKGKVEDVTAQGFTIRGKNALGAALVTRIEYSNVSTVKGESKWSKAFKSIGEYSMFGAAAIIGLPLYGLYALFGDLPSC